MANINWLTNAGQIPPTAAVVYNSGIYYIADYNYPKYYVWDGTSTSYTTVDMTQYFPDYSYGFIGIEYSGYSNNTNSAPAASNSNWQQVGSGLGQTEVNSVFGRTGAVVAEASDYAAYYGQLAVANTWYADQVITSALSGTTALASPFLTLQGWSGTAAQSYSLYEDSTNTFNIAQAGASLLQLNAAGELNVNSLTVANNNIMLSFNGRTGSVLPAAGDYTLSQIGTVSIASPQNGQILAFNGTDWVNTTPSADVTSFNGRTGAVVPEVGDYSLSQIGTVTLTTPASGQVLSYNGTNWVNTTPSADVTSFNGRTGAVVPVSGDYSLSQIGTVTLSTLVSGQVLSYNGTDWVNDAVVNSFNGRTGTVVPASGDYSLSQIGTVSITSPASGQVLIYNGTDWVNGTGGSSGVSSFNGRTGVVTPEVGDYSSFYGQLAATNTWTGANNFSGQVTCNYNSAANTFVDFNIAANSLTGINFLTNSSASYPDVITWSRDNSSGLAFRVANVSTATELLAVTDAGEVIVSGTMSIPGATASNNPVTLGQMYTYYTSNASAGGGYSAITTLSFTPTQNTYVLLMGFGMSTTGIDTTTSGLTSVSGATAVATIQSSALFYPAGNMLNHVETFTVNSGTAASFTYEIAQKSSGYTYASILALLFPNT